MLVKPIVTNPISNRELNREWYEAGQRFNLDLKVTPFRMIVLKGGLQQFSRRLFH